MKKFKLVKKHLLILCCLLCVVSMVSCESLPAWFPIDLLQKDTATTTPETTTVPTVESEAPEDSAPKGDYEMKTYKLTEHLDSLKVIGRSQSTDAGITCDWTASGISFVLDCKGDVSIKVLADYVTYFTVILDGVRQPERVKASAGISTVTIAQDLAEGVHSFSFLKQTENQNSMCFLKTIEACGTFGERPADKELYIEFYGDSITCGYGNLDGSNDASDPGSAHWQDGTQTYAFRVADALNADWSMISVSGIPFSKGYTQFTMGDIMEKISWRRGDTAYSFERKPDLVVINLGTNDAQCGADLNDVKAKAKSMIQTLKGHYGTDQKILFVTGMMNGTCRTELLQVISECGGEGSFIYEVQTFESNRKGGNGHPNMTAHIDVAEEILSFVRQEIFTEV